MTLTIITQKKRSVNNKMAKNQKNTQNSPTKPKTTKITLDKTSTNLGLNLFPKNLPKNKAIELLPTIPQIEPAIKESLNSGYFISLRNKSQNTKQKKRQISQNLSIKLKRSIFKRSKFATK